MRNPETSIAPATGIYCRRCGYDLRASAEARRCPECGGAFAPEDPRTFRPRPFAAPWKRALGRWAKRAAIVLLAVGLPLAGVWGWLYRGWRQEQPILAKLGPDDCLLRPLGGKPGEDPPAWLGRAGFVLLRVHGLTLVKGTTDADMAVVGRMRELQNLYLDGSHLTGAGLAQVENLPKLECLTLRGEIREEWLVCLRRVPRLLGVGVGWNITDAGLAHIGAIPGLKRLHMGHCLRVTDAGLAHLGGCRNLEWLDLEGTRITGRGLEHLRELKGLQILNMRFAPLQDEGAAHLRALTGLRDLDLTHTYLTDAGLANLRDLKELRALNLNETPIGDAGLVHLEGLKDLKVLSVRDTKVTAAGVARLRAALPGCMINEDKGRAPAFLRNLETDNRRELEDVDTARGRGEAR